MTKVVIDQKTVAKIKQQIANEEIQSDHLQVLLILKQTIEDKGWTEFAEDKSNIVVDENNDEYSFLIKKDDDGKIARAFCTLREDGEEIVVEVQIIKIKPNYYDDS